MKKGLSGWLSIPALLLIGAAISAQESVNTPQKINGLIFETWSATGDVTVEKTHSTFSPARVNSESGRMSVTARYLAPTQKTTAILRVQGPGKVTPKPDTLISFDAPGAILNLTARAAENARFVRWSPEGNVKIADPQSPDTRAEINGNPVSITAIFEPAYGNMQTMVRGAGSIRTGVELKRIATGKSVELEAIPAPDSVFLKWEIHGSGRLSDTASAKTEATLNGGFARVIAVFSGRTRGYVHTVPHDKRYTEPNPARRPPEAMILEVRASGSGAVQPKAGSYHVPAGSIKLKAVPDPVSQFKRWQSAGGVKIINPDSADTEAEIKTSGVVTAVFRPLFTIVQINPPNHGTVSPRAGNLVKVKTGNTLKISAVPADGYRFAGWQVVRGHAGLSNPKEAETEILPHSDTVLNAIFTRPDEKKPEKTAQLTQRPQHNAKIGSLVSITDDGTAMANPPPGYFFASWKITGKAKVDNAFAQKTKIHFEAGATPSNTSVSAVFTPDFTQLKLETEGRGTTLPAAAPEPYPVRTNTGYNIKAFPAEGWRFNRWTVIGSAEIDDPASAETTVKASASAILSASFEEIPVKFTVKAGCGGRVEPEGTANVKRHDTVTVKAMPDAGYRFTEWQISGKAEILNRVSAGTLVTANGDAEAIAIFAPANATLTLAVSGDGVTRPESCVRTKIIGGEPVGVSVRAGPEWIFSNWIVQGEASVADASNPNTTATVRQGNALLIANLVKVTDRRRMEGSGENNITGELRKEAEKVRMESIGMPNGMAADAVEESSPDSWVVATDGLYADRVTVFWRYPDAELFEVRRKRQGESDESYITLISKWSGTTYEDLKAEPGVNYVYKVTARGRRDRKLGEAYDTGYRR